MFCFKYLLMAVLGLCLSARALHRWAWTCSGSSVRASVVAEHGLQDGRSSVIMARGFSCPSGVWDLSSQTRHPTCVPCIARWILSPWTTREVPLSVFVTRSLVNCVEGNGGPRKRCPGPDPQKREHDPMEKRLLAAVTQGLEMRPTWVTQMG